MLRLLGRLGGSFWVAVLVLALASGWWLFAKAGLRWWLEKESVPWPAKTSVSEDFRLTSLPEQMGAFKFVPGSDRKLLDDQRETLGIGTSWDKTRSASRQSNWYSFRSYVDTRLPEHAPYRQWELEITCYTGAMDSVPHTPETCLVQGGQKLSGDTERLAWDVPGVAPWNRLAVNRVRFESQQAMRYSQYYLFSLNGRPEGDWKSVRLEAIKPWVRFFYFAKIQFSTTTPVEESGIREGDAKAREFLQAVLPYVLQNLATPGDLESLAKR